MRLLFLLSVCLLISIRSAGAITVKDSRVTASVIEESCRVPKATALFQPTDRQAFLWFQARQVRAGDRLRVEWLDPSGAVST